MIEFAIKSHLLPYDEAWLYCTTCTHNNKYDWRFPTIADVADYKSIIDTNNLKQPYDWFYVTPVRDNDD
jgi:hypothetical protein